MSRIGAIAYDADVAPITCRRQPVVATPAVGVDHCPRRSRAGLDGAEPAEPDLVPGGRPADAGPDCEVADGQPLALKLDRDRREQTLQPIFEWCQALASRLLLILGEAAPLFRDDAAPRFRDDCAPIAE